MEVKRFAFICNGRAGNAANETAVDSAIRAVQAQGHQCDRYECTSDPAESASRALNDGCNIVVACGGDGTVSAVAGAAINSNATLAVIPVGTLNHFAGDLGIPDTRVAEQVLLHGRTRQIDAASVNGHVFVNNSSIGIYPAMVLEREAVQRRGLPKWPAFLIACCKALAHLPLLRLHLEIAGSQLARVTPFVFIGNNVYATKGLSMGNRSHMDKGELFLIAARKTGRAGLIRIAFRALMGSAQTKRDLTELAAPRLTVRTRRSRLHVSVDGEVRRMKSPLEYRSLPGALRVLAP